ncbi:putative Pre-mRNA-splicing factor ATP-dependent RNA helicase PRP43 [Blattamonas nauphoetae]|uniref:RNA helicase n=1 Tax=Blattamonas nauphoetae TaxID=2049346 RepID=A0ABQ9Y1Q8_9EUKA|nr:putative Pre-mRNA-splicing factor ATP-dependent RNA helicase PRP43 [Blattamonas nauphoetae]
MSAHEERKKLQERLQLERRNLPVFQAKSQILEAVEKNQFLVLVGETGSGKTTQIPQFLHHSRLYTNVISQDKAQHRSARHDKRMMIAVVQPRRVAAINVANRVSQEMGCTVGSYVGYSVRFEEKYRMGTTAIKYLTGGMLLREAQLDPMLSDYSIVILDEAHERTAQFDILLGLLKSIASLRPLKLIVMSATIEAEKFAHYLNNCDIFFVGGRQHPVTTFYSVLPQTDIIDATVTTILQLHVDKPAPSLLHEESKTRRSGDIIAFLTGQEEIEEAIFEITSRAKERMIRIESDSHVEGDELATVPLAHSDDISLSLELLPLYAALPFDRQQRVFEVSSDLHTRRVIICTNIAEASVTVPGVSYVVDCGFSKMKYYIPGSSIEVLQAKPISKDSALQRAGRAGREGPGECFRLYPETEFSKLTQHTIPEIVRVSLTSLFLTMKSIGIEDIYSFDFIDMPSLSSLEKAESSLLSLGALERPPPSKKASLMNPVHPITTVTSPLGQAMSILPIEPHYALSVVVSPLFDCQSEILDIVAMLCSENLFVVKHGKESSDDQDHEQGYAAFSSERLKKQFDFDQNKNEGSQDGSDHLLLQRIYQAYTSSASRSVKWCRVRGLNKRSLDRAVRIREQLARYSLQVDKIVHSETTTDQSPEIHSLKHETAKEKRAKPSPDTSFWSPLPSEFVNVTTPSSERILKCLLCGLYMNTATLIPGKKNEYQTSSSSMPISIHPSSSLAAAALEKEKMMKREQFKERQASRKGVDYSSPFLLNMGSVYPEALMFSELVATKKLYLRTCSGINPEWVDIVRTINLSDCLREFSHH